MAILTRAVKGTPLTHLEMDENITDLRDIPNGKVFPKTSGIGIKVDIASPTWGWRDIVESITDNGDTPPTMNTYRGNLKQWQFTVDDDAYINFHLPHDYVPGTDLHIHTHWSHISGSVSSGACTFSYECSYAKSHDVAAFSSPVTIVKVQNASTTQYQHMVAETALSASGGAGGLLDTDDMLVDGIIMMRVVLTANTMTTTPEPFFHKIDIHYQSSNLPTKAKEPDFYT